MWNRNGLWATNHDQPMGIAAQQVHHGHQGLFETLAAAGEKWH
jgi:hypothetical protein